MLTRRHLQTDLHNKHVREPHLLTKKIDKRLDSARRASCEQHKTQGFV